MNQLNNKDTVSTEPYNEDICEILGYIFSEVIYLRHK